MYSKSLENYFFEVLKSRYSSLILVAALVRTKCSLGANSSPFLHDKSLTVVYNVKPVHQQAQ